MTDRPVMEVAGRVIPAGLKESDIWILWDLRDKVPRAPWRTGHMYPSKWGSDVPEKERPETSFEMAEAIAGLGAEEIHTKWSFPSEDGVPDIPDTVEPGVLLPHAPEMDPPIMFVDFDDVRDAETGEVSAEVSDIVERLDAYTEVSKSGTGLHCYVRAELPDGLGKFVNSLDTEGDIELYDHGRFAGGTWRHVAGTPTTVPERQDVVDELILEYEDVDHKRRRLQAEERAQEETLDDRLERTLAEIRGESSAGGSTQNDYYRLDVENIADTGHFSNYRRDAPGHALQGPHPKHGAQSGSRWNDKSSNFEVDSRENCWYCHLHGAGGGALHLIGVLEGVVNCGAADRVTSDDKALLKTCLYARDEYTDGSLDDEDPPYDALRAVAEIADLDVDDAEEGRLGKDAWRLARIVYEDLSATDVE